MINVLRDIKPGGACTVPPRLRRKTAHHRILPYSFLLMWFPQLSYIHYYIIQPAGRITRITNSSHGLFIYSLSYIISLKPFDWTHPHARYIEGSKKRWLPVYRNPLPPERKLLSGKQRGRLKKSLKFFCVGTIVASALALQKSVSGTRYTPSHKCHFLTGSIVTI